MRLDREVARKKVSHCLQYDCEARFLCNFLLLSSLVTSFGDGRSYSTFIASAEKMMQVDSESRRERRRRRRQVKASQAERSEVTLTMNGFFKKLMVTSDPF